MTTAPETGYWFYQLTERELLELAGEQRPLLLGSAQGSSREVRSRDVLFFWIFGTEPGLRGWGVALADGASRELDIEVRLTLPASIPPTELASFPGLSDAPLIRQNQTGTFFRLSAEQALGLCDFLRARQLPAPEIAIDRVIEPIKRRVERELATLQMLLPELGRESAKPLSEQTAKVQTILQTVGPAAGYNDLKALVDALESFGGSAPPDKVSAYQPVLAARAQLANDLAQLARFTISAPEPQVATPESLAAPAEPRPTQLAEAAAPPPPATPPPPLPRPKDPLFQYWEQADLIGIGAPVNNLARYICHEGLQPPLAIGVFGDWGSGKSFFIRALQSQIALLSSQSRDALGTGKTTVFCSHVVQIEFNAWHFVESNLWASLAAHIFDRLYTELDRRAKEEGGISNVDALYQQFSAYKQAVAERERLDELMTTLIQRRQDAEQERRNAEATVRERLDALASVVIEQLEAVAAKSLAPEERERLNELLKATSLEELQTARAEAAAIASEGQTLFGRLRAQLGWWGGRQLALFVAIVGGVLFGLPFLVSWLLSTHATTLERGAALIGTYATLATGAVTWLARSGRTLIAGAQKIERVLTETRERVEATTDTQLQAAKSAADAAQQQLELLDQQIGEQRTRLAELVADLDPNQLGTRLQAFLEAKVRSDTYQKHLGLISVVRRDFSSLYDLMRAYWDQRKKPLPEVLAEVRDALGQVIAEDQQRKVPFIERIVLYIDDLDRCPEDKVVEVLQAVHLMLGLPIFVVVVAVDVRWVGQSIRKHYGRLVGWDGTTDSAPGMSVSATADDYLEKIFQIPYRIHPLDPDVRKTLLNGLLRQPYLAGSRTDPQGAVIQQELVPKELSLYPEELAAIEQLYQSVGSSPRSVRRLLDVYRLMRAGMEEGDVQELIQQRHFGVLLALFALLSGAPIIAPRVIELLRRETLRETTDTTGYLFDTRSLYDWLSSALDPKRPATADEAAVLSHATAYIDTFGFSRQTLIAILRKWIPEIARYSFREIRMQRI